MPRVRPCTAIACALAAGALACVPGPTLAQDVSETEVVLAALSNIWHDRPEAQVHIHVDPVQALRRHPALGSPERFSRAFSDRFGAGPARFCPAGVCLTGELVMADVMRVDRAAHDYSVVIMRLWTRSILDIVEITLRLDEGEWSVVEFRRIGEG